MKFIILLTSTAIIASLANGLQLGTEDANAKFINWTASNNKHYATTTERGKKFENFMKNDAAIAAINNNADRTFTVGHNFSSDMTDEEFAANYLSAP